MNVTETPAAEAPADLTPNMVRTLGNLTRLGSIPCTGTKTLRAAGCTHTAMQALIRRGLVEIAGTGEMLKCFDGGTYEALEYRPVVRTTVQPVTEVPSEAVVSIDMQSRASGIVTFEKGRMLIGRDAGKWYVDMPYGDQGETFVLRHRDLSTIVRAGVRRCGETRMLDPRTHREY